jgi:N-acetylmuramoyl-L-alanine amidase|tara:strand:+ start:148 stop:876 length:729 start_codon:yes stop_codon:yes gene_type:complete
MKIISLHSPNYSIKKRSKKSIKFIVLHYTGMQSERACIKRLIDKKSKVSTHYLINRIGSITRIVDDQNTAWHAGKSKWKNFTNLNDQSIGIELVNQGHQFGYENFSKKQISKLILLCKFLIKKYKIKYSNILGHSDIAPLRKKDPGEKFPWHLLSKKKIGYWHDISKKNIKNQNLNKRNLRKFFFNNLYKIGYRYFVKNKPSKNDSKVIKAFQRRFRPKNVNGLIDQKCLQISYYLASTLKF